MTDFSSVSYAIIQSILILSVSAFTEALGSESGTKEQGKTVSFPMNGQRSVAISGSIGGNPTNSGLSGRIDWPENRSVDGNVPEVAMIDGETGFLKIGFNPIHLVRLQQPARLFVDLIPGEAFWYTAEEDLVPKNNIASIELSAAEKHRLLYH